MLFPRMSALSEVLWTPKEKRNYKDFEKRLPTQFKRYDLWRVHYSKAYFDLNAAVMPTDNYTGLLWKIETNNPTGKISWIPSKYSSALFPYDQPVLVTESGEKTATLHVRNKIVSSLSQSFHFNKATGKKITLSTPPSSKYPGDGAFTLVNGVQNEKGLERSSECLGFEGPDCEAVIDLGSAQTINSAVIHTLNSGGSWVYPPKYVEVFTSQDGTSFTSVGKSEKFEPTNGLNGVVRINLTPVSSRYVKVVIKNFGLIPSGMSGAGNNAWLFVDEIEVK
jgi:hexosaminidase